MTGWDIVGDIHAQWTPLKTLLKHWNYNAYGQHPDGRKLLFLGDLIDRGHEHSAVLETVRSAMNEGGAKTIMGNHEFNALCLARPSVQGGFIRKHTSKNLGEQAQFLAEYPFGGHEHTEILAWFETLPVYIEISGFRAIHACWNKNAIDVCGPFLKKGDNTLKKNAFSAYDQKKPDGFYRSLEILLKGPEFLLPKGISFPDLSGNIRQSARLFWWKDKYASPEDMAVKTSLFNELLTDKDFGRLKKLCLEFNYAAKPPVFVGHYSLPGTPALVSHNVACLNFKNALVGYRWNEGDKRLLPDRLVYM